MLKRCITLRTDQEPTQAVAPNQGAAVFFCSTGTPFLNGFLWYSPISQQRSHRENPGVLYNLLPEKHYFRLNRAEPPFAHVVLTEGQKRRPSVIREVAV